MWDLQTIQLLILRVLQERNTDILAGNWNPELNLWGWADVQEQQLPHFTKQIKLGGEKLQEEKRKTPFSVSIKTLLLFQSEAPATSRVDSSLSTFPLICEDLSWFSITALSFSSSHFLFTRSLTKLVSLSAVRLLPRTETESVYSPDSVSARHWSPFLFCYSLIHTLTRLHTHTVEMKLDCSSFSVSLQNKAHNNLTTTPLRLHTHLHTSSWDLLR